MIDINKEYKTRDGNVVINLEYIPFNSAGKRVTFPIKGTIVYEKPRKLQYCIWTKDGKYDPTWSKEEGMDLVEVKMTPSQKKALDHSRKTNIYRGYYMKGKNLILKFEHTVNGSKIKYLSVIGIRGGKKVHYL